MTFDEPLNKRQPKSCTAARAFKALKNLTLFVGRNTDAIILDPDLHAAARSPLTA